MANTLRIKRRPSTGSAGAPSPASSLYNGELAFNENDNILYYAYGSGVGGVAQSVPAIAGSGAYALRGGSNATGTWPISINGNAAYATNAVYTTGVQTILGEKTFGSITTISGNLDPYLLFKSANAGNYGNIVFDGVNYDATTQSSYIASSTGNMQIAHGQKIQLNSTLEVKAANTAGNSAEYFAVFDSNPASTLTTLKSVSKSQILDDIGAATSGLDITAGSGLVGGGTLSQNRRFDIGQGDGIAVSADSIAVNSTVVRTTGAQSIDGQKTISDVIFNGSVQFVNLSGITGNANYIPVFKEVQGPDTEQSPLVFISNSDFKTDLGLNNVENLALSGITFTAGSGLVGGGTLSSNRTFNIGQGDGISVSTDAIAVDNTVVRTTGNQNIVGGKSFFESGNTHIIFNTADDIIRVKAPQSNDTTYYFVGLDGGGSPPSSTSADRSLISRSTSQVKSDLGLNNVTNDAQIKKIASSTSGNIPFWNGTTGDLLANGYSVETVLAGSSSSLPRADAVKTYVDNAIVSGISTNDAMVFKGAIDCSTNPNYPAADRGWTYKVSVAGKIGGASGPTVEVNDTLICTTDGTSAGTHAVVGSNWVILQTNITDASILVTGPSSSTNNNFAIFDGTTGKIIKDAGFSIVPATSGGTGQSSYAVGDILYANTTTSLAKLADVATGNVLLAGGVNTAPSWGKVNLTSATHVSGTLPVANGGTNQTSYTDGQLLIGNSTGNTLTKATLTQGTSINITNGNGSITIGHADTSTLDGAQGTNGVASITVDGLGHVTAVTTATYLTGATVCAAIADCTIDGGTF